MDWKAELASSIEAAVHAAVDAALARSKYASVEEESADETARRRTLWLGEKARRRIELEEERVRRDPVWAEKMARRHAAFRDGTSTPSASASTLAACAVSDGNLGARTPTKCSTLCPSSPSAASTPAEVLEPVASLPSIPVAEAYSPATYSMKCPGHTAASEVSTLVCATTSATPTGSVAIVPELVACIISDTGTDDVNLATSTPSSWSTLVSDHIAEGDDPVELGAPAPTKCLTDCLCCAKVPVHMLAPTTSAVPTSISVVDHIVAMASPSTDSTFGPVALTLTTTKPAALAVLEPDIFTPPSTTSSAMCFGEPEGKQPLVWSGVDRPLAFIATRDVSDDYILVNGASALPFTLAALGVNDGCINNEHKVALPLKLVEMQTFETQDLNMSPLLPQSALATCEMSVNQLEAYFSGICSDLGCTTVHLSSLLPWDPGEQTEVSTDSVLNREISAGACVKQLDADLSGIPGLITWLLQFWCSKGDHIHWGVQIVGRILLHPLGNLLPSPMFTSYNGRSSPCVNWCWDDLLWNLPRWWSDTQFVRTTNAILEVSSCLWITSMHTKVQYRALNIAPARPCMLIIVGHLLNYGLEADDILLLIPWLHVPCFQLFPRLPCTVQEYINSNKSAVLASLNGRAEVLYSFMRVLTDDVCGCWIFCVTLRGNTLYSEVMHVLIKYSLLQSEFELHKTGNILFCYCVLVQWEIPWTVILVSRKLWLQHCRAGHKHPYGYENFWWIIAWSLSYHYSPSACVFSLVQLNCPAICKEQGFRFLIGFRIVFYNMLGKSNRSRSTTGRVVIEHWLMPRTSGDVLVHVLCRTRPHAHIPVSRPDDDSFSYVIVVGQKLYAPWDPGSCNIVNCHNITLVCLHLVEFSCLRRHYPHCNRLIVESVTQSDFECSAWEFAWSLHSACCAGMASTVPFQFIAYAARWSSRSLDFCQEKLSWDPGIWALLCLLGFFTQAVAAPASYCGHCLDHAYYFDKFYTCQVYYLDVLLL